MNYLKEFLEDCQARGLVSTRTYKSNVSLFLDFIDKDPVEINKSDLRSFLGHLQTMDYVVGRQHRVGVEPSTINSYFSAISSFYDFLEWEDLITGNPVPGFRKRYIRIKSTEFGENSRQNISIRKMIELVYLPLEYDDVLAHALIAFLAKSGLRKGESLAMNLENLNYERGQFTVPPKRKRKYRLGFLDSEMMDILDLYLEWRHPRARTNALWITPAGYAMDKDGPYDIITKYARQLGIHNPHGPLDEKFTPHCCRHWFTTHLRRSGMSREFRKALRGDVIKDAMDLYDHIDTEELRRSYLQHIPRFNAVDLQQTSLDSILV